VLAVERYARLDTLRCLRASSTGGRRPARLVGELPERRRRVGCYLMTGVAVTGVAVGVTSVSVWPREAIGPRRLVVSST
jgi:hypothetical protein